MKAILRLDIWSRKFSLCAVHGPPPASPDYLNRLYDCLLKYKAEYTILVGDFNLPHIEGFRLSTLCDDEIIFVIMFACETWSGVFRPAVVSPRQCRRGYHFLRYWRLPSFVLLGKTIRAQTTVIGTHLAALPLPPSRAVSWGRATWAVVPIKGIS